VTLVSSADETARDVYRVLMERDLLRLDATPPVHELLTTGDPEQFQALGSQLFGSAFPDVERVELAVPAG